MFDHLNQPKPRDRGRDLSGLLVSIAVHLALAALLLYGAGATRRMVREEAAQSEDAAGTIPLPGTGSGGGGDAVPLDIATLPALQRVVPPLAARLPDTLALGRAEMIRLRIPPSRVSPDSLLRAPGEDGEGSEAVRLSRVRQATLQGAGFVVEPQTASLQLTGPATPTVWSWRVTPTRPGPQPLALRLEAVAEVDGRERVVSLYTAQDEVVVRASTLQRLSRFFAYHWTWLSALVGLMAWHWWRTVRGRRRLAAAGPATAGPTGAAG